MTKEQVQKGLNYLRVIDRLDKTLENLKSTSVTNLRICTPYCEVHNCLEDEDIESLKAFLVKKLELNLAHYQNEFKNL
jgi:hypothetical protein